MLNYETEAKFVSSAGFGGFLPGATALVSWPTMEQHSRVLEVPSIDPWGSLVTSAAPRVAFRDSAWQSALAKWQSHLGPVRSRSEKIAETLVALTTEVIEPLRAIPDGNLADEYYEATWEWGSLHFDIEVYEDCYEWFFRNRETGKIAGEEDLPVVRISDVAELLREYGMIGDPVTAGTVYRVGNPTETRTTEKLSRADFSFNRKEREQIEAGEEAHLSVFDSLYTRPEQAEALVGGDGRSRPTFELSVERILNCGYPGHERLEILRTADETQPRPDGLHGHCGIYNLVKPDDTDTATRKALLDDLMATQIAGYESFRHVQSSTVG